MRVSYNWLKQYLDLEMPAEELAKRYTLAGLEYDEVITVGEEFSGVVVAKVLSCDKVENSDHLHICQVDIGAAEPLNIICGAPNVLSLIHISAYLLSCSTSMAGSRQIRLASSSHSTPRIWPPSS